MAPEAHGPPGGEYTLERQLGSDVLLFPSNPPQMAPHIGVLCRNLPRKSGDPRVFLPIFVDIRVLLPWLLLTWVHVFFSEIVLQRNHLIRRVELFELSPILLLSRCLEAC